MNILSESLIVPSSPTQKLINKPTL